MLREPQYWGSLNTEGPLPKKGTILNLSKLLRFCLIGKIGLRRKALLNKKYLPKRKIKHFRKVL